MCKSYSKLVLCRCFLNEKYWDELYFKKYLQNNEKIASDTSYTNFKYLSSVVGFVLLDGNAGGVEIAEVE